MTDHSERHGQPYQLVDAKRSFDNVEVSFDWHDFLASKWAPGITISINSCIRLTRSQSKGLQFRAMSDGVTGRRVPNWPSAAASVVADGSVTWVAEAITTASLRTTIVDSDFPSVDGITLSSPADTDLVYRILVAGGTDGQTYEVQHQVVLANGEEKEGVAVLPVLD